MTATFQPSLLDLGAEVALGPLGPTVRRTPLAHGAWVDLRPAWVAGADVLFQRLANDVPWYEERRRMYDRIVDVPRLLCFYDEDDALPDASLEAARRALNTHYRAELGEPFRTVGLCYYRDGRDSVAWHGDTIGRGSTEDTMVAIVSVGDPRALLLRPRPGLGAGVARTAERGTREEAGSRSDPEARATGASAREHRPTLRHELGHGDLLVMGGSCQRTWEHAIPKTARPVGPRISIQFRPRGVR
jgi:alkylated DNA repair dioxygenase AlkB